MVLTLIWMVSNGDVGSSPRRQSGGAKDSDFTTSISPTPGAWLEGSVERCDDSELREEEEQGEDGSDFTWRSGKIGRESQGVQEG